jgi:hypothetical protein
MQQQVQQLEEIRDTRPNAKVQRGLRCRVRITNTNSQQQIPGHLVPHGVSECVINKKDLPAVMSLLEPEPEKLELACKIAAEKRKVALSRHMTGVPASHVAAKEAEFEAQWAVTPQGEYRNLTGGLRDPMPFSSVEVLDDNMPESVDEDRMAVERVHAQVIGDAIRNAVANQGSNQKR